MSSFVRWLELIISDRCIAEKCCPDRDRSGVVPFHTCKTGSRFIDTLSSLRRYEMRFRDDLLCELNRREVRFGERSVGHCLATGQDRKERVRAVVALADPES